MFYEVAPYRGHLTVRESRRVNRAISHQKTSELIRLAGVEAEAHVAVGKVAALGIVAVEGETVVGQLTRVQRQMEQVAPEASSNLGYITDLCTVLIGGVLQDLRTELRDL